LEQNQRKQQRLASCKASISRTEDCSNCTHTWPSLNRNNNHIHSLQTWCVDGGGVLCSFSHHQNKKCNFLVKLQPLIHVVLLQGLHLLGLCTIMTMHIMSNTYIKFAQRKKRWKYETRNRVLPQNSKKMAAVSHVTCQLRGRQFFNHDA
jgi:hypothetical protein